MPGWFQSKRTKPGEYDWIRSGCTFDLGASGGCRLDAKRMYRLCSRPEPGISKSCPIPVRKPTCIHVLSEIYPSEDTPPWSYCASKGRRFKSACALYRRACAHLPMRITALRERVRNVDFVRSFASFAAFGASCMPEFTA